MLDKCFIHHLLERCCRSFIFLLLDLDVEKLLGLKSAIELLIFVLECFNFSVLLYLKLVEQLFILLWGQFLRFRLFALKWEGFTGSRL